MAHGQPDFGANAPKETIYSLPDLGELAARLGSVMRYNRSGNLLWYDDFRESVSKWTPTYSGGTGSWGISPAKALIGGTSGLLTTPSMSGSLARIETDLVYPVQGKIGFEAAITQESTTSPIDIKIEAGIPPSYSMWVIRYAYETSTLSIFGSDGAYHMLSSSLELSVLHKGFHHFKVIIDLATDRYHSLKIDNSSYPVTAYSAYKTGIWPTAMLRVTVEITNIHVILPTTAYIGAAIITQNEA